MRGESKMANRAALFMGLIATAFGAPSALPAATEAAEAVRVIPPSTVVMDLGLDGREMQRPAVEFDHAAHTAALGLEACARCHLVGEDGQLSPEFVARAGLDRWDRAMDAVHAACIGCHSERRAAAEKSGPVTCGECHVRRAPGVAARAELPFDASLHARHALAYPDRCETCHHVRDEEKDALVYLKGAEAGCPVCHGETAVEDVPSRADASHRACVSCHLLRLRAGSEAGPVRCVGCHDRERHVDIERLEEVPRLMRGQPDRTWVTFAAGTVPAVPFDHIRHEGWTPTCSGCHHAGFEPCDACHTLRGSEKGGGVTLADAFHDPDSTFSCVGCHRAETGETGCRGCHSGGTGVAAESSCSRCHTGPLPRTMGDEPPEVRLVEAELGGLPEPSDDLPETVVIEVLADRYGPSKLPHGKIVRRLHAAVAESPLATRFHGRIEVGCAGCHHHSPVGLRPPRCSSCHGDTAHPTRDQPALKAAYHRQCIECHEVMKIEALGCTDCHPEREVAS